MSAMVLALLVLVGLVMLLTNPKTRPAGWAVSVVLLVLILGAGWMWLRLSPAEMDPMPDASGHAGSEAAADVATTAQTPTPLGSRPETGPSSSDPEPKSDPPAARERPSWVGTQPHRVGESYRKCVTVGPYADRPECDARLPEALQEELVRYVKTHWGPKAAGRVRLTPEIREAIVRQDWEEPIQASFGPMIQLHVLLEFDRHAQNLIQHQWHTAIVAGRLWYSGIGLVAALVLLSVVFGYLRIDQATGGSFRGRLRLAAAAAILTLAAAAWLALRCYTA